MKKNKSFKEKINNFLKEWWVIGLIAFIAMLTIFIFGYFYFSKHSLSWLSGEVEELGQMGDFFGGTLNPILAFLSFCLLLITIKLQSKELKNSTKELAKSSKALKKQSKSLKIQNFENTFFNMINLHNQIVDNSSLMTRKSHFDYRDASILSTIPRNMHENKKYVYAILGKKVPIEEDKDYHGRKAISKLFDILDLYISLNKGSLTINKFYDNFYEEYNEIVGHYFRNIYQILKFIDSKELKDKKFYSNILRAQLSSKELALLLINSLSDYGKNKLFPLLVKYEFMEPLPLIYDKDYLLDSQIIDNVYLKDVVELCIEYTKQINEVEKTGYEVWKIFGKNKEESNWEKYIKHINDLNEIKM